MKAPKALFGIITIALSLSVQLQGQTFLTNGLVAYYPFNGNANDASGNGNNGTVVGAVLTTDRFGNPNSAYWFNGVSSRIIIPDNIITSSNTEFTVSVWITTDAEPYSSQQQIFYKSRNNGEMNFCLFVTGRIKTGH